MGCFDGDVHQRAICVAWWESVGAYVAGTEAGAAEGAGEGVVLVLNGAAGESCAALAV